ncbi:ArnT family glycosyltransferase [Streptomyces sp. NPDC101171]|uniref:ArnT family glycosyltransferase n=1 Tax=Streptomyces sp. NPDC101171 TaxID=3366122 RepID=UPI0038103340
MLAAQSTSARPALTRTAYWIRLLPALAALACVTRMPSFARPLWNPDEGYLAVQAGLLAHGGRLYETVVDRKPPLLPWLYEAAFALCGHGSLTPLRVLAVAAQLLTAALLASVARRRWGDTAGRTAGVLYLLVSVGLNPEDAQAATFEVFILPGTAAALWCADRGRWGTAGTAVACAFLTKQTGGAVLLPVVWLLWRRGGARAGEEPGGAARAGGVRGRGCVGGGGVRGSVGGGGLRGRGPAGSEAVRGRGPVRGGAVRLAAGFALPVACVALATDPAGFLFWTVTGSATYASFTGSELLVLGRGLANTAILAVACAGLIPPVVRVLRAGRPAGAAGAACAPEVTGAAGATGAAEAACAPGAACALGAAGAAGAASTAGAAGAAGAACAPGAAGAARAPGAVGAPGAARMPGVMGAVRAMGADLWLWLASSAGAVVLGFHFFGHYYLQLLPPAALLATAALQLLPRAHLTSAVLTSAGCCALFLTWGLLAPRAELAHAQRLATALAHRTTPADRVLVWGIHPETYWLADRTPASRYLTAGLLTNYSGGRDGPRVGERYAVPGAWPVFRAEMAARAPALVVDDSRGKPYRPERVPSLRRLLEGRYEEVGRVDGAVLYARIPGA